LPLIIPFIDIYLFIVRRIVCPTRNSHRALAHGARCALVQFGRNVRLDIGLSNVKRLARVVVASLLAM
jgi:hypothetical protein